MDVSTTPARTLPLEIDSIVEPMPPLESSVPELVGISLEKAAAPPAEDWLRGQLDLILSRLSEHERINGDRERIIDRLHEENQRLKQGELHQSLMPIYRDLTRLFDDLQQTAQSYSKRESVEVDSVARDWQSFAESVADILYRYGVDTIPIEPGSSFDPKTQRAISVVKTDDPARERTIARVFRAAFAVSGKTLRTADIEVFRYEPPAPSKLREEEK
jgi:molecular chaperone GrpE